MDRARAMTLKAHGLCRRLNLEPPIQPQEFVSQLAESMGITIGLVPFPMLQSAIGYVLRLTETEYYIFYDPDASTTRTIHHECGHIIFDHVPICTREEIDAFLKAGAAAGRVPPMFRRANRFALPMELDAEGFGLAMTAYGTARGINLITRLSVSPAETDAAFSAISLFYDGIGF